MLVNAAVVVLCALDADLCILPLGTQQYWWWWDWVWIRTPAENLNFVVLLSPSRVEGFTNRQNK